MALRKAAAYWKLTVNGLRVSSSFTTSTSPKMRAYAASTTDHSLASPEGIKTKISRGGRHIHHMWGIGISVLQLLYITGIDDILNRSKRHGEFIPVYVLLGFIALQASFGLFTAFHQMARSPNVTLKKSRRETIPEVVEPERMAEHGERFLKQSFFRKIAHIQDFDRQEVMDDPIRGDVFTRPVRLESLKEVGVEVKRR
ncbi:hypothetical protein OROHE_000282 [Orobanche hederae]